MAKSKRKKFYAVAKGHKTGVYKSWGDCREQVEGYSNNRFKGFETRSEAADYVQKYSDNTSTNTKTASTPSSNNNNDGSSRKRMRREDYGTSDDKRSQSAATRTSASNTGSAETPYESGYFAYYNTEDGDDPVRDYYHMHGFYGYE